MNKKVFLSLALAALVSFSVVRTEDVPNIETPDTEIIQNQDQDAGPEKEDAKKDASSNGEESSNVNDSRISAAWERFRTFYKDYKMPIRVVTGAVALTYVTHKIMYIQCPWYRDWVDGTDEESEANKLPWARI